MRRRGFTLVEVAASMVFIGITLVAILKMVSMANLSQSYKKDSLIASNLLQRKMEEIRSIKKNNFSAVVADAVGSAYAGYPGYILYVAESTNWKGNGYLTKIDVSIKWPGTNSPRETVSAVLANY